MLFTQTLDKGERLNSLYAHQFGSGNINHTPFLIDTVVVVVVMVMVRLSL
jgi:hypothetical protein